MSYCYSFDELNVKVNRRDLKSAACKKCLSSPYPSSCCVNPFKLRLLGGTPIWGTGSISSFGKEAEKRDTGESKPKKESHLSKVSILKKKSVAKISSGLIADRISSFSNVHDELDSGVLIGSYASTSTGSHSVINRLTDKKLQNYLEEKKLIDPSLINSPEEKQLGCKDIVDYDDDNDNNVISTEVSLSSVAQQNDGEDITVMESFSESNLGNVMSSPLESDEIADEYLLFHGNMVVDMSDDLPCSDKEENEERFSSEEGMHVVIRSPTTSDDEYINPSKIRKKQVLTEDQFLRTTDSAINEDMSVDSSESQPQPMEVQNTEVTTERSTRFVDKTPEEQISTKEDFEELIDERSRKGFLLKSISSHFPNTKILGSSTAAPTYTSQHAVFSTAELIKKQNERIPQKVSVVPLQTTQRIDPSTATMLQKQAINALPGTAHKLTGIILHNPNMRKSMLGVPNLVSSTSSAITIVNASTSQIASILPSHITVPLLSASAVRQLPNVKVIDKPSTSLSLTTQSNCLPKNIFEEDTKQTDDKKKAMQNDGFRSLQEHKIAFHRISNSVVKLLDAQNELNSTKPAEHIEKPIAVSQHVIISEASKSENIPVISQIKTLEIGGKEANVMPKFIQKISATNLLSEQLKEVTNSSGNTVVIRDPPELKMTAHVVHQKEPIMHITTRTDPADDFANSLNDESKSVVISIPSPTPSQEQILDNIALQALESTRKDGKCAENEFQTFEDVLDMIENITNDPPVLAETKRVENKPPELKCNNKPVTETKQFQQVNAIETNKTSIDTQISVAISNTTRPSVIPQLSPLSQPTDLTTNMANVSQQLRSLLSSLHTTTVCTNTETKVKNMAQKLVTTTTLHPATSSLRIAEDSNSFSGNSEHKNSTKHMMGQNLVKTTFTTSQQQSFPTTSNTAPLIATTATSVASSSMSSPFATQNILFSRCVGNLNTNFNINSIRDRVKVSSTEANTNSEQSAPQSDNVIVRRKVSTPNTTHEVTKPTFSLAAILQSHPVSVAVSRTFNTAPASTSHVQTENATSVIQSGIPNVSHTSAFTTVSLRNPSITSGSMKPQITEGDLTIGGLKLKYMRSNVIQNKAPEELATNLIKYDDIKKEAIESSPENKSTVVSTSASDQTPSENSQPVTTNVPVNKDDDSQNVLLKKLLQNTACASTQTPPTLTPTITTSLKQDCNSNSLILETQLIKPNSSITSILPPVTTQSQPKVQQRFSVMSRETSFVSNPVSQPSPVITTSASNDMKTVEIPPSDPPRPLPVRTFSREELPSPQIPKSEPMESHIQPSASPVQIKKEFPLSETQPVFTCDVKKELIDENSQNSENSEAGCRLEYPVKEEPDSVDTEKLAFDQKEELKKQKRRLYQQKRRQNQLLSKELVGGQPKKRARKSSKVEEDYDTFIDGVLSQLRQFPPMNILEPQFNRNFSVVPVHGSGDLTKVGSKEYNLICGDLSEHYGSASIPGESDFYSTTPHGDLESLPQKPSTTQREFYDQEFPIIKFETDEEKQFDLFCREDTPDSVVSDSSCDSPICDASNRFVGLKLIEPIEEDEVKKNRMSPVIPIVAPIPIRLKAGDVCIKEPMEVDKEIVDKENIYKEDIDASSDVKPDIEKPPKDNGNITVTLTLTSSAAENIMGVLRDLANILHIPPPTSYQIVDRTTSPPNDKYGMYKGKGKEKEPVDIQSVLNGATKFCKHCDVVILNKMIRKKVSELPFLAKDSELLCDNGELSFCSSSCYMQFSLIHRSPTITEAKALEIIDHMSQKSKTAPFRAQPHLSSSNSSENLMKNIYPNENSYKKFMDTDINYPHLDFKSQFQSAHKEQKFTPQADNQVASKLYKGIRYKAWTPGCLQSNVKFRKPTDKETIELLYRSGITVTPAKIPEDTRRCIFCQGVGDGVADGPARLLNFDVDKWIHLNCGLWSDGVYETVNGALMNLENALQQSLLSTCVHCNKLGATIRCFKTRCTNVYHLNCAVKDCCVFFKNKTMYCMLHVPKNEKDNELTTLSVSRRVYVNRDENRQVAAVMHYLETNNILRVGSLILLNVGQLLPHQLQNFHNANFIFPIGYKIIRFYWSMRKVNKRCRYICSILENAGIPEFKVLIQEPPEEDIEFKGSTPRAVWDCIFDNLTALRKKNYCVQFFPKFVSGEDLFGLTEPAVARLLENLPGIDTLNDYKFKYGRNPLLELPLAINPSGCARTEARSRSQLHWKRHHTRRTTGTTSRPLFNVAPPIPNIGFLGESCPYSKQFVHSKSSQYKKMKQEWRNNVFLARSKIQGLGLYAARDLEKHTMVIEYIGEMIRTELAETREKKYDAKNRGIYMFRLDEDRVVDATLSGGLARYINHSCNPNCVAEIVEVDRDLRIIIFAKRRIQRGEELAYDYKFDIEDDQHKIACMCGAPNCRKWMN